MPLLSAKVYSVFSLLKHQGERIGYLFSRIRVANVILLGIISQAAGMFSNQNHRRDFHTAKAVGAHETTDVIDTCL